MNLFTWWRPTTAVVGCLAIVALVGCDFMGFGDRPVTTVESEDNDQDNDQNNDENNDENNDTTPDEGEYVEVFDEQVNLVNNYSDPIEVEIPDEAYAIAISITEGDGALNYMVTDWSAPDGFEMVPAGWENNDGEVCYPGCNLRVMQSAGANGVIAPNNPDAEPGIQPGTHEFTVHSASAGQFGGGWLQDSANQASTDTVRVSVYVETAGDAVPEAGTMDLNLFFTGSEGWTADTAADDPDVQAVIEQMDGIFDQVNVDIGEVAYYDVDGDYRIIEDLFGGTGDLSQMFAQSERAELEGPSVFFVEELQSPMDDWGGGGGVLGISGGIPGPMIVDGSPRSGVAVSTEHSAGMGAPGISNVTAHELGHYLGLFHTTEQTAGFGGGGGMPSHDPLPDTEEFDESYLMHATGSGTEMSEWQGRVMRNNAWVNSDD